MAINSRRIPVEVFGESVLLHGVMESARRVTDVANEGEPFLVLSEIETYPYIGDALLGLTKHARGLVNRDSIVLLAERDATAPAPLAAAEMRIPKLKQRILVYTNHFAVNADLHLPVEADLETFLKQAPGQFVPVTNATVIPLVQGTQLTSFRRHFVLINRIHIAYLGIQEEGGGEPAIEEADRIG